MGKKLFF